MSTRREKRKLEAAASELPRIGYSALEVAKSLGVSEKHVKNLLAAGEIPSVKLGQRRIVLETDLRAALAKRVQNGWQPKGEASAA